MAVTAPEVGFDRDFFASAHRLDAADAKRVFKALDLFGKDPDHSSLNLHPIEGDRSGRLYSIRASHELRILLAKQGNVHIFLEVDHHDDLYARAGRGRFVVNPGTGFVGLVGGGSGREEESGGSALGRSRGDGPGVFDHWATKDLTDAGFSENEVDELRRCRTEDDLLELDWDEESLDRALDLIELTPEEWRTPSLVDLSDEPEQRIRQAILERGALWGLSPLFGPEELARIAAAPIEDWMIFLHPDQRTVVERRYEGPARVKGAAGTGKTVVGLHRAAALAERFRAESETEKILFTTFIRTLPPVFEQLFLRLPESRPGDVEFIHVDRLAWRILAGAGHDFFVEPRAVEAAYAAAWRKVVRSGSPIARAGLSRSYVQEELAAVIKGRGIRTINEYLAVERTGRRTRLAEGVRRHVWDVMLAHQEEMGARGTLDFPDVVLLALEEARRRPTPTYRAAIIDEAQDITLVGLQLVRTLVNGPGPDRPDGLLLVGDAAQRIYPGGFTLRQAGIEVRGRTTVLRTNYRTSAEILAVAMSVAGGEDVEDLDERYRRSDEEAVTPRSGPRPRLVDCSGPDDELRYLVEELSALTSGTDVGLGDIGVFASTNQAVTELLETLTKTGVPSQGLDRYDGKPSQRVKVGTFHRAKGLEFKVVFLPGLSDGRYPRLPDPGQGLEAYAEARALALGQLFVAMTRARDKLYILCSGNPSDVLAPALDRLDVIDS